MSQFDHEPADLALDILRLGTTTGSASGQASSQAVTTNFTVDEAIVVEEVGFEPLGLVSGAGVARPPYWGRYNSQRNESAELVALSKTMHDVRTIAMTGIRAEAHALGADGVVGVQLSFSGAEGKGQDFQFVATGTAIRSTFGAAPHLHGLTRSGTRGVDQIFTSDLSGRDFALLARAGYLPSGLVMGVCVFHVGRRGTGAWLKNQRQNIELTHITEAMYDSRELAMDRMQAEARSLGSDGIVGVRIEEKSHVWGSHVIEFLAIGTAVSLLSDVHLPVSPDLVVPLDDLTAATDPRRLRN